MLAGKHPHQRQDAAQAACLVADQGQGLIMDEMERGGDETGGILDGLAKKDTAEKERSVVQEDKLLSEKENDFIRQIEKIERMDGLKKMHTK